MFKNILKFSLALIFTFALFNIFPEFPTTDNEKIIMFAALVLIFCIIDKENNINEGMDNDKINHTKMNNEHILTSESVITHNTENTELNFESKSDIEYAPYQSILQKGQCATTDTSNTSVSNYIREILDKQQHESKSFNCGCYANSKKNMVYNKKYSSKKEIVDLIDRSILNDLYQQHNHNINLTQHTHIGTEKE
jgi:hypothetical protein